MSSTPHPQVLYVAHNGESAPCPKCRGLMVKTRKVNTFTWKMCCAIGFVALFNDFVYKKEMKCLGCGHDETV